MENVRDWLRSLSTTELVALAVLVIAIAIGWNHGVLRHLASEE